MGEERKRLLKELEAYADSDFYPYHMPGHKRNLAVFPARTGEVLAAAAGIDITEIDGFDNLHEPEGLLREAMERAAKLYGADHTFFSVNGSTAGILTAVSAAVPEGGTLIMARNCHRAVYHAVYLRRLTPVYLVPEKLGAIGIADAVTPEQVEAALREHPEAAAVLVTSPTYDGLVSDVGAIARTAHRYGKALIVDSAHGAHFGFHPQLPESAVCAGADLTAVSLHKTMPCLTQTALLHVRGDLVDPERLRLFEGIYQTSSPSYLLMAAMDECTALVRERGAALWDAFFRDRGEFLHRMERLERLRVYTAGLPFEADGDPAGKIYRAMDPGKLLIGTVGAVLDGSPLTGKRLYDILRDRWHLQMEMAAGDYVTAIMTCCDRREGWERLAEALLAVDEACAAEDTHAPGAHAPGARTAEEANAGKTADRRRKEGRPGAADRSIAWEPEAAADRSAACVLPEAVCSITRALDAPWESVSLKEAKGRISAAFLNLYPPGIPIAAPGERLDAAVLARLETLQSRGLAVVGIQNGRVKVLA